jgi:hypothetical protein
MSNGRTGSNPVGSGPPSPCYYAGVVNGLDLNLLLRGQPCAWMKPQRVRALVHGFSADLESLRSPSPIPYHSVSPRPSPYVARTSQSSGHAAAVLYTVSRSVHTHPHMSVSVPPTGGTASTPDAAPHALTFRVR